MKKFKVALSWLMTLLMMMSLLTCFQTASAATLQGYGITLDDSTVTAVADSATAFTVKIPDGHPRVPQVVCADAEEIVQAYLPEEATEATATVTLGGQTYTITFKKDASMGFVLQYNDYYTWDTGLSGTVNYTSSNTGVATVDSNGVIHIERVSTLPVEITAENGSETKTLTITTIRAVLGVWWVTGQSNADSQYGDASAVSAAATPKRGTGLYFGGGNSAADLQANFVEMTNASGKSTVGGLEPAMAAAIYAQTGEKVLLINSAIAGSAITQFIPGSGEVWTLTNQTYEAASALWSTDAFAANYELRMRSYFFCQGCAEWNDPTSYYIEKFNQAGTGFSVNGVAYNSGIHTFHTYMTEVLGFDACMNIMIAWRPVGIATTSRTAQFQLAEDIENFYNVTRINQTLSVVEGTYRSDNLHYTQVGRDMVGMHAASNAVRIYKGDTVTIAATGATAYFNRIGYADGDTFYVKPGDFYNYYTRPDNYDANDRFVFEFEGDDVVDFDGENDFNIKSTATPGSSTVMKIYSETDTATPLAGITIQVVGEADATSQSIDVEEYAWDFTGEEPTVTAGDIDVSLASDTDSAFDGKQTMVLSRDLTLDSKGYWSIEWKASNTQLGSMAFSSYAGAGNYFNTYYSGTYGWYFYRNGAANYFWQTYTAADIVGEHTYKLETRDDMMVFYIDGKVVDTRELLGSGTIDTTYNLHYILGGIGTSGSAYELLGDVSYFKVVIGEAAPEITEINEYAYLPDSGSGTATDPYIINANVAEGAVITPASFVTTAPAGTVSFSAEKMGGTALTSLTCDAGTNSVYVMLTGPVATVGTIYYQVNFTVSADPDIVYDTVMVDKADAVVSAADGTTFNYEIEGQATAFTKGKNLFTSIDEAIRMVADDGVVHITAGTYGENVSINKSVTVKGAQAGVSPNLVVNALNWNATRTNASAETTLTGSWTLNNRAGDFTLDGVTFSKTGAFTDARSTRNQDVAVTWNNVIVTDITSTFKFGEVDSKNGAVTGSLIINNMRAEGFSKTLMNVALEEVVISNSYFDGSAVIGNYTVPGVVDTATDHKASYTITECLFEGATKVNALAFDLTSSVALDSYDEIIIDIDNNVFVDTFCNSSALNSGFIYVYSDTENMSVSVTNNLVYQTAASAANDQTAFIYGVGKASGTNLKNMGSCYQIAYNNFIAEAAGMLPAIFSSEASTLKNHNNVNVSHNYSEAAGECVEPVTNTTANGNTNGQNISYYKYYCLNPECTEVSCDHTNTYVDRITPSCTAAGVENIICHNCEQIVSSRALDPIAHIESEWIIEVQAGCTTAGNKYIECTVCHNRLHDEPIAATGHEQTRWKTTVEPTCNTQGVYAQLCTNCLEPLQITAIPATENHNYVVITTVEATCAADGSITSECSICKTTNVEVVGQKLHTPGEWVVAIAPGCDSYGVKTLSCSGCGMLMQTGSIDPAHNYVWVELYPAGEITYGLEAYTCSECGDVQDLRPILPEFRDATDKFEDISTADWYVKNGSIDMVYTLGLYEGTGANTFSPNAKMTRAMFVTVLGRLSGAQVDHYKPCHFTDVAIGKWYTGYISWAYTNDIVDGTSYSTFAPNNEITREQMCKIIVDFCNSKAEEIFELPVVNEPVTFKDQSEISSWAAEYVTICQRAGVISGRTNGNFDPKGKASRAEVATVIMNLINAQYYITY